MSDTSTLLSSRLRDNIGYKAPNSSWFRSTISEFNDIGFDDIMNLLATAEYFYAETEDTIQYFTLDIDEISNLVNELEEFNFKMILRSPLEFKLNDKAITYSAESIYKNLIVYIYYGCGTTDLKTFADKSFGKLSQTQFEELNAMFSICGPTIKEIIRPYLNANKIRLYE